MKVHFIRGRRFRGAAWILALGLVWVCLSAIAEAAPIRGAVRIGSEPVEGAVVYLKETGPKPAPVPPMQVTIRQEDKEFTPFFTVVPVGSTLLFENNDHEMHNVHSTTPGNRFDVGAHNPGEIKKVVLEKPGPITLRCKIHTKMRAIVFVSPSAYFATTGTEGKFELQAPAGSYRIEAWHPRLTPEEITAGGRAVTVGAEAVQVDLALTAQAPAGANLIDVPDQDWGPVVDELGASIDQVIERWKQGGKTVALAKMMTARSRLYGESGLRSAVIQKLGDARAEEHEAQFNTLIKLVQKEGPGVDAALRTEKEKLLSDLKKDIQKMK